MHDQLIDVMPVLRAACAQAIEAGHPHIGSEQLALLALPGPDGLEAIAREAGVDPTSAASVRTCCTSRLGAGEAAREPRITPRTARLCAFAAQLALLDGSTSIDPLHLAAALLEEPGAVAWAGLRAAGITPDIVLSGILRRRPGWWRATPAGAASA